MQESNDNERLLTAKEAAAFLRVSLNTLWRLERRRSIIPYRTPDGHRRYSVILLNAYLEQQRHITGGQ